MVILRKMCQNRTFFLDLDTEMRVACVLAVKARTGEIKERSSHPIQDCPTLTEDRDMFCLKKKQFYSTRDISDEKYIIAVTTGPEWQILTFQFQPTSKAQSFER